MIIWGTKVKRRRVGYVADYCAVCHEPRLFELIRVGIAGHLYFPVAGIWLAGLFTFPYFIFTRMRSFIRGELEPRLARAWAPLDPTLEELDTVYGGLRAEKRAIAKKTKPHRVLDLIVKLRREENREA